MWEGQPGTKTRGRGGGDRDGRAEPNPSRLGDGPGGRVKLQGPGRNSDWQQGHHGDRRRWPA